MNDPRTCCYAVPRAFGDMNRNAQCTRPRGQACLCGLQPSTDPMYVQQELPLDVRCTCLGMPGTNDCKVHS